MASWEIWCANKHEYLSCGQISRPQKCLKQMYSSSHTFIENKPLQRWIILYKRWSPKVVFIQFEVIINVLVSSFQFIWIPMLWVYVHYKYLNYFSAGIVFIHVRQNLTYKDVRFSRIETISALKGLTLMFFSTELASLDGFKKKPSEIFYQKWFKCQKIYIYCSKAKRQYLLTCKVKRPSKYCNTALH